MLDVDRFLLSFVLIPSSDLCGRLIQILEGLGDQACCHVYWALGSGRSSVLMVCSVFCGCLFSGVLLRCERLPFASQLVWLKLVRHGAGLSQTQCD